MVSSRSALGRDSRAAAHEPRLQRPDDGLLAPARAAVDDHQPRAREQLGYRRLVNYEQGLAAVAGYLVGLIGNSNNPISGLTLTALLVAAVLMVAIGVTDMSGVAGVLAVAGVVCCAAGIA